MLHFGHCNSPNNARLILNIPNRKSSMIRMNLNIRYDALVTLYEQFSQYRGNKIKFFELSASVV